MSRIIRASTSGGGTTIVIQTAAEWAADVEVYPETNLLVTSDSYFGATDQRKFKIADGVQTWTQLNYIPISGYDDATGSITFLIDNNGALVTTGTKAETAVAPYGGIITGWQLFETSVTPVSCTATLDVYRDSYTNYPPVVGDALTWTKPSLTAATKNSASGLSIAFTSQDNFRVSVDANDLGKVFKLVLFTQKTS